MTTPTPNLSTKTKINIEELTIKEAREIARLFGSEAPQSSNPYEMGAVYLIRTVTMIDTGKLVRVTEHELVLTDAAWIADTGRFADAIEKAEFSEVEPFPDGEVIIGRGAVIDAVKITRSPRRQE